MKTGVSSKNIPWSTTAKYLGRHLGSKLYVEYTLNLDNALILRSNAEDLTRKSIICTHHWFVAFYDMEPVNRATWPRGV